MTFLDRVIDGSVRNRWLVLLFVLLAVGLAVRGLDRLTFDAFPDLTNTQVQVVTTPVGMGSEEVEMLVTLPLERAMGGLPDVAELRSISRPGVSSITIVFEDGTDPWLARQMVKEQLDVARSAIPEDAGIPELAPPTTGLGEVVQFTVASDEHRPADLYRVFERDIAPRIRAVDGVVEVNAWGAGSPQLDVVVDPWRLAAHGLTWTEIHDALGEASAITSGGNPADGSERSTLRVVSNPDREALGEVVVRQDARGTVRLADVAEVVDGQALTVGLGTADGEGDVLFAMVQLLAGADARSVVREVDARMEDVRRSVPDGVRIEGVYDREKLVGNTLSTVSRSLIEGGLLVVLVLLLLLGDVRSGLLVASVIPLAMLGAFTGLTATGQSGNLMSLGAIDFGLVVDGTIVVVESIVALELAGGRPTGEQVAGRARAVARPVLFAVGVLILVYLPILLMEGTEGKLFRPMALTVLFALGTALVLSFTYIPAAASLLVRPRGHRPTWVLRVLGALYRPLLDVFLRRPALAGGLALLLVVVGMGAGATLGVEFTPRLEEGDLVIQTARLPSLSPREARLEATRVERIVKTFPEVERIASRTGSPAVATDPMGLEEADILVRLAPKATWTTAHDLDGLVAAMEARLTAEAPGPEYTFTQPIEMRFNELLEGITADVGIAVHGDDLEELLATGQAIADVLAGIPGAADVKAPTMEGMPGLEVVVDPASLARLELQDVDVHGLLAGVHRGTEVGVVRRGQFLDAIVLKTALPTDVELADLPVVAPDGHTHTVGDVASIAEVVRPAIIKRSSGSRRVIVQANVRGRDLGGFVGEARAAVEGMDLPDGTWLAWSGAYEQLEEAAVRTAVLVPTVLGLILIVLYYALGGWKAAWLIFLNVPVAVSGGVLALVVVGLPLSMSAVVGFIALSGIAVMNGIVLVSRTAELLDGRTAVEAAHQGASERFRPVLMTAFVAGIGFLPMALAHGVGAEVQRPLATVVIGGLITATPLTLMLLPALFGWLFASRPPVEPAGA